MLYRFIRGPRTPWARLQEASKALNRMLYGEIARRRETGERGEDVLSLLLDAQDDEGEGLTDEQIRDEMMTLLFAGHDTTTSTVSFMFYELARAPELAERLLAEQRELLRDGAPNATQLMSGELMELEMTLDETLRKYPPAWIGPRKSVEAFEFEGHMVPANAYVTSPTCSQSRMRSARSASPRRQRPNCPRARTSRLGVAHARASECASGSWRCARSRPLLPGALRSSCPATSD